MKSYKTIERAIPPATATERAQLPPPFTGNISFNAQHSPAGAFMSFTCGHFGGGGGIGVEIGRPAPHDLFVGVKRGDRRSPAPIRCLPFVRGGPASLSAASFTVAQPSSADAAKLPTGIERVDPSCVRRHFGWATDAWVTPEFTFTICTPFDSIPEPGAAGGDVEAMRRALLPAVIATLSVDNREGNETKTGVFAMDFLEPGARVLAPVSDGHARAGFAFRRHVGVLGTIDGGGHDGELMAFQRWSVAEGVADINPVHGLGTAAGIAFEIPPGKARTLVLAIGCYLDGIVTTGVEAKYLYTRYYSGLQDVLDAAVRRAGELRARAARLDEELLASGLSADQQFLVAHGTRGYYGSTQLLDLGGEPLYVVNEGEYCMMNTLDLAIDQAFWELDRNPWVVRNILDAFVRHYSYHDQVKHRGGKLAAGGISFAHDMGVNNNFSPPGQSSYELPHLKGCFSYMTVEQLCNWLLLAECYVAATGDRQWLTANEHVLSACGRSLKARCHPRTGVPAFDSARCGPEGQEITTYDSLDESLGQARGNSYLAVKVWAAWLGLQMIDGLRAGAGGNGNGAIAPDAGKSADVLADHLVASVDADGTIPGVLEPDSPGARSRTLPVVEGLIYPAYWARCLADEATLDRSGDTRASLSAALNGPLAAALRRHVLRLLTDPSRRNLFADGGIKLSSTSDNSWASKIALFQHVARHVLRLHEDAPEVTKIFAAADAAHVRWQTDGSGYWACSDQFVNGEARGSRYYPRIVTAALWLSEPPEPAARPETPKAAAVTAIE